jgi:hypothetical protein
VPGPVPYSPYNYDAWTINFGFVCAAQFTASGSINGFSIVVWLWPGDTLSTVDAKIGSRPDDWAVMLWTVSPTSGRYLGGNQYGYDIYQYDFAFTSLDPGTYWLTLQNAVCPSGDPIYWDVYQWGPFECWENTLGDLTQYIDGAGTFTFKCDGVVSGAIN